MLDGLEACRALVRYEGSARALVTALKYRNHRTAVPWLGIALGRLAEGWPVGVVTWVPTTRRRRGSRGFDQGQLLARSAAAALGVRATALLKRRDGGTQTGRNLEERLSGPALAASGRAEGDVLLVDDVLTTGATLREAARALRRAGAASVRAVTIAHTPLKCWGQLAERK